jgi:predicted Zn-dependent peptidase
LSDRVELTVLPSGLRVVTERMPQAHSVAVGAWVGVGARDEPAELAGVSHFLEHLLFKGSLDRSARDIAIAVDRVGGEMNAFTTKEYTAYYTRLPASALGLGLEILGDVLTVPALRDEDVESERQVILEELCLDEDTHDDKVHTLAQSSLFPDHPLGWETAGERSTIAAIAGDDVRRFFSTWYRPEAVVVAAAGALDHDAVVAEVERRFVAPAGGQLPVRRAPGFGVQPLAVQRRSLEQVHLALAYRGVARADTARPALDVVNHILGGGMSSRLFDEIRERRGLAYAVYSTLASYCDAGSLMVYAGTSARQAGEVLSLVDQELARLAEDGPTEDELAVAKGYLTGSFLLGLEDPGSRMARLGTQLTTLRRVRTVAEQVEQYAAVTRADVHAVIERVLAQPRVLAAVGPVTKKALLAA